MKKILLLVITLFSVIISYSQVSKDTIYSHVSKDTIKTINLNSIEISGARPSVNTPISQKTISNLDIEKQYHGQEMTYILEKTPSVTTQSDGGQPNGYTYFKIRGIDQTRINVTLNGSPLNELEDMGAYYSNYPGFATNIKSMQVQRGIGTSSNGTASYGGSINFESKTGLDKGLNATILGGAFNTQMYNINYSSGLIDNRVSLYGSVSTYKTDGYRKHSGGDGTSAFFSVGSYNTNDVFRLTGFVGQSTNELVWTPTPESILKIDRTANLLSDKDKDNFAQRFIQVQQIHNFSKYFTMSNTLFFNNLDGKFNINDILIPSNYYYEYNYLSMFYGINTNLNYTKNNLKLNAGYNVNIYSRKHFGTEKYDISNDIYYDFNNTGYKNDFNVYIKPTYSFNKIELYGDVQFRYVTFKYNDNNIIDIFEKDWNFLNTRFGATYTASNTEKLYTYIGKSFREPTRTDMFGGWEYNGNIINITPESVIDYELGYKLNTNKLNFNINLYYMYFNNQYVPSGKIGSTGLMIMTSVDKSYRSGVEFDITHKITKNLSISNISTLSNNKILSNIENYILYTPNMIINQDIDYKWKSFYINVSARYLSKSYIDLNDKTAVINGYTTLNSIIGCANKHIDLSLTGINLTNTNYYTSGNITNNEKCYFVGVPISFYTTLKIKI